MSKLRRAAKGRTCMIRLTGCQTKPTVLAHYRMNPYCGVGMKPPDIMGAWACQHCHDVADGRKKSPHDYKIVRLEHAEGVLRTLAELEKDGIIGVSPTA